MGGRAVTDKAESALDQESPVSLLPGVPHGDAHNSGRPISWVGVSIIIVGFVIGGVAFIPHPTWWAVWVGSGVAAVGLIFLAFTNAVNEDWY
jgi:hypothetical protein